MATGPGLVSGRIVFPLARTTSLIGRTDRASEIYPDIDISPLGGGRNVSRRHAEVIRQNERFHVRDLASKLGTLVNGETLGTGSHELSDGDAVTIGDVTLTFSSEIEWPEGLIPDWEASQSAVSTETQPAAVLPLIAQLPDALRNGELLLHYQPQIDLATGEVGGLESLLRWKHPEMGMVEPDSYITLAEDTGFIRVVTGFVLQQAATDLAEWRRDGVTVRVGVNLSVLDLQDPTLVERVTEVLDGSGLQPSDLVLEATETAVMFDPGVALATLTQLRLQGFRIAIDDFGTGQSSLAYLKDLPAQEVKLDKSFSSHLEERERTIIAASVQLAHDLKMTVVAEGVEDEATASFLREIGCDRGQGYFFGKPAPKDEVDFEPRTLRSGDA